MGLNNALRNRPVRVLGFIAGLHAILYGIGLWAGAGGFGGTVLYHALDASGFVLGSSGVFFIVTGGLLCFAYIRNNPKTIRTVSSLSGTVWLFATFIYILEGAWLLSLAIALPWAVIAYYLAYAHSNRVAIIAYDQTPQAKRDTFYEDQL